MSNSGWMLPALVYAAALALLSIARWHQTDSLSFESIVAITSLTGAMCFGVALCMQLVQVLRATRWLHKNVWLVGLSMLAIAFSWRVATELVDAITQLRSARYHRGFVVALAIGCSVALNGLRTTPFKRPWLVHGITCTMLALLLWVQDRYRMQLREGRYAGVSLAFLLLSCVAGLRTLERLFRSSHTPNGRSLLLLSGVLGAFVSMSLFISPELSQRFYFRGLIPGRVVFAVHMPAYLAQSKGMPSNLLAASARSIRGGPAADRQHVAPEPAEVVIVALLDAVRFDKWLHDAERPNSKMHGIWMRSCVARAAYSPASGTALALEQLLLAPETGTDLWLSTLQRSAGVTTTLVLDGKVVDYLENEVRYGFGRHFDQVIRLGRTGAPPQLEPVVDGVRRVLRQGQRQQLIWAHFFDVHEWYGAPGATEADYQARVSYVEDQLAELISELRSDERRTTMIILADHGEGLDHFSTRYHGQFLYEPLVRVPFMIWTNGGCESVSNLANVSALSTTLLGRLVLEQFGVAGDLTMTTRQLADLPVLMHSGIQRGVIRWPFKLITSPWFSELYDLEGDPLETRNLATSKPGLVKELHALLP